MTLDLDKRFVTDAGKEVEPALPVRLLPGGDATADLVAHRGQAEVDRIDRVTRNITRAVDHTYWLRSLGLRAAFVRRGDRIVAYAYGGASQVGPVAGGTQEAALAALGVRVLTRTTAIGYYHQTMIGMVQRLTDHLPELPAERAKRFEEEYKLSEKEAGTLSVRTLDGHVKYGLSHEQFLNTVQVHIAKRGLALDLFKE